MSEKDKILDNYNALFEKDENGKALSEEAFLDRLIALESSGKTRLFRTLLGDKSNQEVREYLNTKGRKEWEKIVSKEYLGKSMTIVDIINQYSKMIKDTFKTKPTKEALNELGIQSDKLDGVILPSEGNQRIRPGTSEGGEESEEKKRLKFKEYQEKIKILFSDILTVENGVHPGDLEVFEGKNEKDMVRYASYIAVKIPKLGKTIFINDREGESTFVCDKLVSEHDMVAKSKKKFYEELGSAFHSVNYSDKNEKKKEQWKRTMIDLIFGPEKGSQKFVREALIDEKGELTELGKEWFESNTATRPRFRLSNNITLVNIAKIFGFEENRDNLVKNDIFYQLSVAIFGGEEKVQKYQNIIRLEKQEKIRRELIDKNGELTEKGKERFGCNTTKTRQGFKLSNNIGIGNIARIFGFEEDREDFGKDNIFYQLSVVIFGGEEKVQKYQNIIRLEKQEKIRRELIDKNGNLTEKGKERFESNTATRPRFKLPDGITTYVEIARNFGFKEEKKENLVKDNIFYQLSIAIFGVDNENVKSLVLKADKKLKEINFNNLSLEERQEKIRRELIDKNGELTEKGKEWFEINTGIRLRFKLPDGITAYVDIARNFGFKEKPNNLIKDNIFYKLSVAIFGGEEKVQKYQNIIRLEKQEKIRRELIDKNGELTEKGKERFESNTKTRHEFKLSSNIGIISIARNFGFKEEKKENLVKDNIFYKLSAAIFGEDNENVKFLKNKLDKKQKKQL